MALDCDVLCVHVCLKQHGADGDFLCGRVHTLVQFLLLAASTKVHCGRIGEDCRAPDEIAKGCAAGWAARNGKRRSDMMTTKKQGQRSSFTTRWCKCAVLLCVCECTLLSGQWTSAWSSEQKQHRRQMQVKNVSKQKNATSWRVLLGPCGANDWSNAAVVA